jgi:hypothetical protein
MNVLEVVPRMIIRVRNLMQCKARPTYWECINCDFDLNAKDGARYNVHMSFLQHKS